VTDGFQRPERMYFSVGFSSLSTTTSPVSATTTRSYAVSAYGS